MEDEPRIARQFKYHYCCVCKNFRGKVVEDGRKVSLHRFPADRECVQKTRLDGNENLRLHSKQSVVFRPLHGTGRSETTFRVIRGSCHKHQFCRDKDVFDKHIFVAITTVFVATNTCLSRQKRILVAAPASDTLVTVPSLFSSKEFQMSQASSVYLSVSVSPLFQLLT